MSFELTILGSSSAIPSAKRHNSTHLLNISERFFLIDCAEGVQIQILRYGFNYQKINHIFISHLHADHYLGIFGLLSSLSLLGRKNDLHIFSHSDLKKKIDAVFEKEVFTFQIVFHELNYNKEEEILDYKNIKVISFPLEHKTQTCGFLFKEKDKQQNIKKEVISEYNLNIEEILAIKNGSDLTLESGQIIPNSLLTIPAPKTRSYAYCSDTKYSEKIIPVIKNTDLLYHEATFDKKDLKLAQKTGHSTAEQAAEIAKKAEVGKLLIGHFSRRYKKTDFLLSNAKEIFENSFAVNDGDRFSI